MKNAIWYGFVYACLGAVILLGGLFLFAIGLLEAGTYEIVVEKGHIPAKTGSGSRSSRKKIRANADSNQKEKKV